MIRIMIADRHPIVRQGLKRALSATGEVSLVAEATTRQELWDNIQRPNIDVLIGEISLFGGRTCEMLGQIRKRYPYLAIVVFSMHVDNSYVVESLRGGATAYVSKAASVDELMLAIRHAASGKRYVDSALRNGSDEGLWSVKPGKQQDLSPREAEVLELIAEGKRNGEIAGLLGVSTKTVSTHRAHILEKTKLTSNQQIVRHVLQRRLQRAHPSRQTVPSGA